MTDTVYRITVEPARPTTFRRRPRWRWAVAEQRRLDPVGDVGVESYYYEGNGYAVVDEGWSFSRDQAFLDGENFVASLREVSRANKQRRSTQYLHGRIV